MQLLPSLKDELREPLAFREAPVRPGYSTVTWLPKVLQLALTAYEDDKTGMSASSPSLLPITLTSLQFY